MRMMFLKQLIEQSQITVLICGGTGIINVASSTVGSAILGDTEKLSNFASADEDIQQLLFRSFCIHPQRASSCVSIAGIRSEISATLLSLVP